MAPTVPIKQVYFKKKFCFLDAVGKNKVIMKDCLLLAVFIPVNTPEAGQNPLRLAGLLIHS